MMLHLPSIHRFVVRLTPALLALLLIAGCTEPSQQASGSSATTEASSSRAIPAEVAAVLAAHLPEAPAVAVGEVVSSVPEVGAEVVVTGYIGGRRDPFISGRSMFMLADIEKAPACADGCPIPWDACCTPREVIAANSLTVRIATDAGEPLKTDINGMEGLVPGAQVTVAGLVRSNEGGVLLLDARALRVIDTQ